MIHIGPPYGYDREFELFLLFLEKPSSSLNLKDKSDNEDENHSDIFEFKIRICRLNVY